MKRLFPLLVLALAVVSLLFLASDLDRRGTAPVTGTVPEPPRLSPPSGVYQGRVSLTMGATLPGGEVVWTADGTRPTASLGMLYADPIALRANPPRMVVIQAVERVGEMVGPVAHASYVLGLDPALPIVSLVSEPADLWDQARGLHTNLYGRGSDWEREVHVTGFSDGVVTFALPGGLRVDGREPANAPKQSFRLYFRSEYGAARMEGSPFDAAEAVASELTSHKRLLLQAGDHGVTWSLLRDQVVSEIARDLGVPAVRGQFVWLFVNGSSWGLYRLTERVDRFYLEDAHGITMADVVQEGDAREGSDADWEAFIDRVESLDLADPMLYETMAAQMNVANFIDVAVLARFFELPAEGLIAVQPRGGRWLWFIEGGGTPPLRPSDFDRLLDALLKNPAFRAQYEQRLADLLNTVLQPASLEARVSRLEGALARDFEYERARWPGVPSWEDEVAAFSTYTRARADTLGDSDRFPLTLHLSIEPQGAGKLYVNGQKLPDATAAWEGQVAEGAELSLVALPAPGYDFADWQAEPQDQVVADGAAAVNVTLTHALSLTVTFSPRDRTPGRVHPDDVVINEIWINDDGTPYATLPQGGASLEGDWIELLVRSAHAVDLRGWRLTDNDTKTAESEGSLIFPDLGALSRVPCGTVILIVATDTPANAASFPTDDLDSRDGQMILYVGNGALDAETDPGFAIGTGDDNVVLLAPGDTPDFADDVGIDFVAEGRDVTPATFGVLADGVAFDVPFSGLGGDDGAVFTGRRGNDGLSDWIVDPPACASQDQECLGVATVVTPGELNPGQQRYRTGCLLGRLGLVSP